MERPPGKARAESGTSLIRASGLISLLTLFSRILGLVRDMLMARFLGRGWEAGAFFLAWTLPNLFRRLLGEGALSAAFIPNYVKVRDTRGREEGKRLFSSICGTLLLVLSALVLAGLLAIFVVPDGFLVSLFSATGVPAGKYASLLRKLLYILFPYLFPICLLGFVGGALQAEREFLFPGIAPVLQNVIWICALLAGGMCLSLELEGLAVFLSFALLAGGFLQVIVQLPALKGKGLMVPPRVKPGDAYVKDVARDVLPAMLGLAVYQINVFFDQVIAATLVPEAGANAVLYYANRLFQFPLALIGTAVSTASFPGWSSLSAGKRIGELERSFLFGTRRVLYLAIPSAIGLAAISIPLVHVFFVKEHGLFTAGDGRKTAMVLVFLAPALPFVSFNQLATRLFQSGKDFSFPVKVGTRLILVNIALNLVLVNPMGISGLAIATSVTSMLRSCILMKGMKRLGLGNVGKGIMSPLPVFVFLGAIMGAAVFVLATVFESFLLKLCVSLPFGALLYFSTSKVLGLEEADIITTLLKRKRG